MKLFGTDGIRGKAGVAPLDRETVARGALAHGCLPPMPAQPQEAVAISKYRVSTWIWPRAGDGGANAPGDVPTPAAYLAHRGSCRHRDPGIAQSIRRQRHQGVLRRRRKTGVVQRRLRMVADPRSDADSARRSSGSRTRRALPARCRKSDDAGLARADRARLRQRRHQRPGAGIFESLGFDVHAIGVSPMAQHHPGLRINAPDGLRGRGRSRSAIGLPSTVTATRSSITPVPSWMVMRFC